MQKFDRAVVARRRGRARVSRSPSPRRRLAVLLVARLLADEEEPASPRSLAENRLRGVPVERTAAAIVRRRRQTAQTRGARDEFFGAGHGLRRVQAARHPRGPDIRRGTRLARPEAGGAMIERKKFRCPQCGHSEIETVPHLPRCPKCGFPVPRPERDIVIAAPGRRPAPRPPI